MNKKTLAQKEIVFFGRSFLQSKKAQVTIFVILGIVFLFIASFVMYLTQMSAQSKLESQAQEIISEFTDLRDVQDYTQLALSNAANDAVEKIFLEGGYFTDDLPPSMEGKKYLPYTYTQLLPDGRVIISSSKVYYGVVEQVPCLLFSAPAPNTLIEETSYYPIKKEWLNNYYTRYNSLISQGGCLPFELNNAVYSGFLGGYEFPALCSFDGANANNNAALCGAYQYDYFYNKNSIQRQLEEHIKENLHKYVNVSYFEKRGTNLSFNLEQSNITIFYTNPTGLVVTLSFPAGVNIDGRVIEKTIEFDSEIDGSFRQLHSYVQELLMKSLKDPYFNITRDWNNSQILLNYKSTFKMFIHKEVCLKQTNCLFGHSMDDDIYTFVDPFHSVNGRPLTLNVAIQNRRPVLDFVHDTGYDNAIAGYDLDKQYYTNATLLIDPYAIDPDLDNITYTYYGWKQNYNQYLNETCCAEEGGCNITNHVKCYLPPEIILEDNPKALMNSELYRSTNRSVNYQLNDTDLGFHNITLVVEDEHGLIDFQIIKLLIFDLPKAVLNFSNGFQNINNNFASVEDFFILNASSSQASSFIGSDFSKIIFLDDDEPFQPPIIVQELEYELPGEDYDFTNITRGYFNFSSLEGETSKLHNVRLIVAQQVEGGQEIQSPPDLRELNVSQCLPHGLVNPTATTQLDKYGFDESNAYKSTWPYPFGTANKPPHICCNPIETNRPLDNLSGGEFASSSKVCFEKSFTTVYPFAQYDEMVYLRDVVSEVSGEPGVLDLDYDSRTFGQYPGSASPINPTDNKFNDIYHITLTQQCSGNRGNACSGGITISNSRTQCEDITQSYQFARCQMPGYYSTTYDYDQAGIDINPSSVGCVMLDQKSSFELNFYNSLPADMQTNFLSSLGLSNTKEELFLDGYCGTSDTFNLDESANLVSHNNGVFECKATCSGSLGCDYTQNNECQCNNKGDEECEGSNPITANQFFDSSGNEYYVCKDDGACDRNCDFKDDSKGACYCEVEGGSRVRISQGANYQASGSPLTRGQINWFFDASFEAYDFNTGDWLPTESCCKEGVLIYYPGHSEAVCFNGEFIQPNVIFANGAFVSHDGLNFCEASIFQNQPTYEGNSFPINTEIGTGNDKFKCTENGWIEI